MSRAGDSGAGLTSAASWWRLSAVELGVTYERGTLTPVAVVDACYERITALNPKLGAFVALCRERASAESRASTQRFASGAALGPLDGIPFAVKDNICCEGMPTTWGSPAGRDHRCDDEPAVARLRAAGAILIGKTNAPEFTLDGYTSNPLFGTTRNPWNPALTPGGSSGGSVAAVAAGLVPLAIGTDGGGSIRRPVSHTGLTGLKPSIGTVARSGGLPQLLLDFEVIGPIARSAADARLLFDAMAGPLSSDRDSIASWAARKPLPDRLRIAWVATIDDAPVDPQIADSCRKAALVLGGLGHEVIEQPLPIATAAISRQWAMVGQVGLASLFAAHPQWAQGASPRFVTMARDGALIPATALWSMLDSVTELRRAASALFERIDLIITPAAAALPWPAEETHPPTIAGQPVGPRGHAIFTGWVNAAGLPAIALPCSPSAERLPIGLQAIGAYGTDAALLDFAQAVEAASLQQWQWPAVAELAP